MCYAKKNMKKKNIYLLVAASLIVLMISCHSLVQSSDLSGQSQYKKLIGKHYIVLKDFYLTQLVIDQEEREVEGEIEGDIVTLYPCGGNFPEKLDKNHIGDIINNKKIIGVLPKHSTFTLMKVTQYELDYITLICPFISISSKYNNVLASILFKDKRWNMEKVKEISGQTINRK